MSAPANYDELPNLRDDGTVSRTFKGRLPDPSEVVRWGGQPGCTYTFCSDTELGKYRRAGWVIAQGTDGLLLTVEGPKGPCDIFVLVRGKPILGSDPANGTRVWLYDPKILERTGLETPYPVEGPTIGRPRTATLKHHPFEPRPATAK